MSKLFSANPSRMGRFDGPPTSDAVPDSLVDGTRGDLKADLIALLGKEKVLHRAIDLVRYASDASPYRLIPQVVVLPRTTDDIVKLFRYCRETGRHATFRAAGTSLNGQSLSDDILIDVRRHWYGAKVMDDGRRVWTRPGMILNHVNALLERHGRRLGPDPASSNACTIGGVIANNSGGMYAGRKQWPLRAVRVHLVRSQATGAEQIDVTISFVGELSEEQRRRLLEIAEHCPVHRMLTSGVGIRSILGPA